MQKVEMIIGIHLAYGFSSFIRSSSGKIRQSTFISYPTDPFTILQTQDREIVKFYVCSSGALCEGF